MRLRWFHETFFGLFTHQDNYVIFAMIKFAFTVKEKEIGEKEKTIKILYNQLLSPKTSYEEFLLLPEEDLITIATEFIKKEKSAFECYCDNGNFYADFNLAFRKMFERQG